MIDILTNKYSFLSGQISDIKEYLFLLFDDIFIVCLELYKLK